MPTKSDGKSKKSGRGGRRAGAGRKKADAAKLRSEIIAETERAICTNLPKLLGNMLVLANGGYERVEEKWVPGGAEGDGPLVLSERKVTTAEPDRAANVYLIDRVLGRPRQSVEVLDPDARPKRIVIPDADDRPEPDEAG